MLPYDDECDYLVELREKTCDGAFVKVFVNFDPGKDKTFGQLLNHSSVHPNVEQRYICPSGTSWIFYLGPKERLKKVKRLFGTMGVILAG